MTIDTLLIKYELIHSEMIEEGIWDMDDMDRGEHEGKLETVIMILDDLQKLKKDGTK